MGTAAARSDRRQGIRHARLQNVPRLMRGDPVSDSRRCVVWAPDIGIETPPRRADALATGRIWSARMAERPD